MNLQVTRRLLAGFSLVALIAFVIGCSAPSSSLSPTGPTAVVAAASGASVSFSPNPDPCLPPNVINPTTGACEPPPPPPPGTPCSPGYWKNHEDAFNGACVAAAALPGDAFTTCGQLMTALTCKGSDASCGRHAAAAALNTITSCVEDD